VQDVLRDRAAQPGHARSGALIFAVGVRSMVDALRALAPSLGIRPEDVITNH
jgi:hypothetical protein